jgi:hypothetical protein
MPRDIFETPKSLSGRVAAPELRCTCQQLRENMLMCVSVGDMSLRGWNSVGARQEGRVPTGIGHATTTCHIPALILPLPSPSHLVLRLPCHGQPHQRRVSAWRVASLKTTLINEVTSNNSIEIATRAADHFTRLYYSAYDSSTRVDDLPNFYRPNSAVSWNGNPYEGSQGVRDLIAKMPKSQHEVQSFDCHPIPGEW